MIDMDNGPLNLEKSLAVVIDTTNLILKRIAGLEIHFLMIHPLMILSLRDRLVHPPGDGNQMGLRIHLPYLTLFSETCSVNSKNSLGQNQYLLRVFMGISALLRCHSLHSLHSLVST